MIPAWGCPSWSRTAGSEGAVPRTRRGLFLAQDTPGLTREAAQLTSLNSGFKVFFLIWVLCLAFFPRSGFSQL